jgi:hypothetical protein
LLDCTPDEVYYGLPHPFAKAAWEPGAEAWSAEKFSNAPTGIWGPILAFENFLLTPCRIWYMVA